MQKRFEAVEAVAPECAVEMEPVDHGGQCIGLGAIVSFASLAAMPYQPGALEDGEVLGDSGLRYAGVARQCVDGLLAVAGELLKNGAAGGMGKAEDLAELDMPAAFDSDGDLAAPLENEESAPVEAAAAGGDEVMSLDDDLGMEFNLDDLADAPAEEAPAAEADDMLSFEAVEDVPAATEDALPGLGADDELAAFDLSDEPAAARQQKPRPGRPPIRWMDCSTTSAQNSTSTTWPNRLRPKRMRGTIWASRSKTSKKRPPKSRPCRATKQRRKNAMTDLDGKASEPEPPATPPKKPAKDAGSCCSVKKSPRAVSPICRAS